MRLGTADVLVRAKTDKFNKDIDKSEKKVKSFAVSGSKSLSELSKSFVSLAGPAGVAALTASLAGVIAVGARFEKQMATVRGIARANEKDFKLLSDAAKKMGATTEWSATQSAEALEFMALAGWNVQKSIEGLPLMLDAATAAGSNLAETSDILTDTLTAMGLEIEDMDRLTDVMVGTTTRANTNFLQMGEALKEAAPYARAYGFEIEEVAALLGVVADAGIKASDAGTGLKNTWIMNARAAKLLGTDATDLIGTLRAANKAQWDANKFAEVYGKIAGKTVLNIAAQIDKYEALAETLHDVSGETKELADIKLDTLIGDWDILKSSIEGLGNTIYASIVTPVRASVRAMSDFISIMNDAVKAYATTWAALGLYSVGVIDLTTAIFDGVDAVETFDEALGPEKLRLAFLERIIETGKYTSKVYWEAKKLRELIDALPDIDVAKTKEDVVKKKKIEEVKKVEVKKVDDSWIKNMQAQEAFAIKMSETEQSRLNARYELEQEINTKIHDELLSDTDFRLKELDSQFLAYDGFVQDKVALDAWYVKQYKEIVDEANAEKITIRAEFDLQYAEMGKSRFDIERMDVERMREIYDQAGIDKTQIAQLTSDKIKAISKAETEYKISQIQSTASMMADGFEQISAMGGKHSKEAFATYKAFKIVETLISTQSAAMKAYESLVGIPIVGPTLAVGAAAAAVGFGMAQVAMISGMQPPSYDQGGISNAQGIYQTGDIAEAHVPLPSGGKIPVQIDDKKEKLTPAPTEINIMNVFDPVMMDEFLASSRGQDAIVNIIGNRAQSVKRILR